MKIAITGAAGNAGAAVCRELSTTPHELRLGDVAGPPPWVRPTDTYVRCDTRTPADVDALLDGADAVVHLAAWHCAHAPPVSDETIFAVNVDGTFNVVQACRRRGIKAVVFASSMAYGHGSVYGATKVLGEDLMRTLHHVNGAAVVNLRYHEFLPCPYLTYGPKLLRNGVDRRDVATATVAAVAAAAEGRVDVFTTVVHNHLDAPADVLADFAARGPVWLETRVPGAARLIERYALPLPARPEQHDLSEAARLLNWWPAVSFVTFLADLARRDAAGEDVRSLPTTGELPR